MEVQFLLIEHNPVREFCFNLCSLKAVKIKDKCISSAAELFLSGLAFYLLKYLQKYKGTQCNLIYYTNNLLHYVLQNTVSSQVEGGISI